jgi:hypothetical protein
MSMFENYELGPFAFMGFMIAMKACFEDHFSPAKRLSNGGR